MNTYTATNLRQNLYSILNNTIELSQPVKVSTKKGDAVIISAEDFASMEETVYLLSIPNMREKLLKAKDEPIEDGVPLEDIEWLTK